jgi:hypothetical protein
VSPYEASPRLARAEALEAIPAMLTLVRRVAVDAFEVGDPESDELRRLLDACVVGAHRLRLREKLRAKGGCENQ